jgi:hypothetical protein
MVPSGFTWNSRPVLSSAMNVFPFGSRFCDPIALLKNLMLA